MSSDFDLEDVYASDFAYVSPPPEEPCQPKPALDLRMASDTELLAKTFAAWELLPLPRTISSSRSSSASSLTSSTCVEFDIHGYNKHGHEDAKRFELARHDHGGVVTHEHMASMLREFGEE
eukprot:15008349-Alexandrium_andersonii.AAC.1